MEKLKQKNKKFKSKLGVTPDDQLNPVVSAAAARGREV